jgi:hypothetical protein
MPSNSAHAIIQKSVINLDHGGSKHIMCAWDDCENDGFEMYKLRINYGKAETPHYVMHVFCSDRHKDYFINSARRDVGHGKLPPGCR